MAALMGGVVTLLHAGHSCAYACSSRASEGLMHEAGAGAGRGALLQAAVQAPE